MTPQKLSTPIMMKYNPPWYCTVCLDSKNYKTTGKYKLLSTRLHQRNLNITKDFLKLENELIDEPKTSAEVTADLFESIGDHKHKN